MAAFNVWFRGEGGVGKTQLVRALEGEPFDRRYIATLGADVSPIRLGFKCFNLWDCAGQEKFRGLDAECLYRADVVVECFDLTALSTFAKISLDGKICKLHIIVGLKADLEDHALIANDVQKRYPNLHYFEVSAKTGSGIQELKDFLIKNVK